MPTTIKSGDTGDDVKRLQRVFARMKVLGPDNVDGILRSADRAGREGLPAIGTGWRWMASSVRSHGATYTRTARRRQVQTGSLGPVVAMLQGVLKTGFGYVGAIDGIFGPVTEAVVRQYQTDSGLPVTGVMDERTWMAPAGAAGATLESLSGLIL